MKGKRNLIRIAMMWLAASSLTVSFCFSQQANKERQVEKAFADYVNDSIAVQVNLKYDEHGLPDHYFCHVNTPVCEHGLCKLMVIDIYWDVLGNFLEYETPSAEPLTKFDHFEFTKEDHEKLNGILADRASILRDYPVDDLVDHRIIKKSGVVDAVSAATRAGVKDAIVGGAVYSTYTLWHIVNGPIASRIETHTKPMLNAALLSKMFQSNNVHYQYFALNYFPEDQMAAHIPEIINLVKKGNSYIPYFAIEKLTEDVWNNTQYQVSLIQHFGRGDFELQNAFLNKMKNIKLSTEALDLLIAGMADITDKQLIRALEIIGDNTERLSRNALSRLAAYAEHTDAQVSAQANLLLRSAAEKEQNPGNGY